MFIGLIGSIFSILQGTRENMIDGFYVGYMSAQGYGVVLFIFRKNRLVGTDVGGVRFDGKFASDSAGSYSGNVTVKAPPNVELIQGVNSGPNGLTYDVPFSLPSNFLEAPFIKIATPFGAVNIKLEKLRDLGEAE
jgi:hypothetical protein